MLNIFKIALRNLSRYKRRTILVGLLIALGVVAVQVFVATSGSYKTLIVSQITDAMLGHLQIHKKGYLISVENVPMNLNIKQHGVDKIESILKAMPEIEAYSLRIRLGGMISNFTETTNLRVYGIDPVREFKTVPLLPKRIMSGTAELKPGQILVPQILASGLNLKVGAPVVIIATNKDGSVNGKQFTVGGIVESAPGPGGRDGYIGIADAVEILRMDEPEISEIAVHVKHFDQLQAVNAALAKRLSKEVSDGGKPKFEVHTWEKLAPFANIAKMIDLLTVFIRIMLIAIVLISVLDVMMMSVYERTREIGTLAAIGTMPGKIVAMFVIEGGLLGLFGAIAGNVLGFAGILAVRATHYTFSFGMREGFVLDPSMRMGDVLFISAGVLLISILGSLQPALKASRLEPIKALKSV
jgi:putative ABC transport system permease protein